MLTFLFIEGFRAQFGDGVYPYDRYCQQHPALLTFELELSLSSVHSHLLIPFHPSLSSESELTPYLST